LLYKSHIIDFSHSQEFNMTLSVMNFNRKSCM